MATNTVANKTTVEEQIAAILQQLAEQKGENEQLHSKIAQMQASAAHQAGDQIKVMGLAPGSPRTREQVEAFLAKEPPKTVFFCDPPGTKLANAIHPKKNFDPKTGQAERVAGVDLEFRDYKSEGAEIMESRDGLLRPKLR